MPAAAKVAGANPLLNVAGVKATDVAKVDLRPTALRHAYNDAQIKVVKYYDNIRFVYEIESKVRELKRANTPPEAAPERQQQKENRKNVNNKPAPENFRTIEQNMSRPPSPKPFRAFEFGSVNCIRRD